MKVDAQVPNAMTKTAKIPIVTQAFAGTFSGPSSSIASASTAGALLATSTASWLSWVGGHTSLTMLAISEYMATARIAKTNAMNQVYIHLPR